MKIMTRLFCLLLTFLLVFTVIACEKQDANKILQEKSVTQQETTIVLQRVDLTYYTIGNPPDGADTVLAAINEKLLEKVGATLEMRYSGLTDVKERYHLELTVGEADMMVTTDWTDYGRYTRSGDYLNLEYLLPAAAPKLFLMISIFAWEMCYIEGSLYAIPNAWPVYESGGVQYREDLRAEYALPVPNTLEKFETYIMGIKENMPEQGLMTVGPSAGHIYAFDAAELLGFKYRYDFTNYGLALDYDRIAKPVDYWFSDDFVDDMKLMKKWADNGFWAPDALHVVSDKDAFNQGISIADVSGTSPLGYIADKKAMEEFHPYWEVGYAAYGETTGVMFPTHATQNATVLTRHCRDPKRALQVIEAIMTQQDIYNTVFYGVEGTDYQVDNEGFLVMLDTLIKPNGFNTSNFGNGKFIINPKGETELTDMFKSYHVIGKRMIYPNVNVKQGFFEDHSAYENGRNAVFAVMRQYLAPLQAGLIDDVDQAVAQFRQKAIDAGVDVCKENFIAQWTAYCIEYAYE